MNGYAVRRGGHGSIMFLGKYYPLPRHTWDTRQPGTPRATFPQPLPPINETAQKPLLISIVALTLFITFASTFLISPNQLLGYVINIPGSGNVGVTLADARTVTITTTLENNIKTSTVYFELSIDEFDICAALVGNLDNAVTLPWGSFRDVSCKNQKLIAGDATFNDADFKTGAFTVATIRFAQDIANSLPVGTTEATFHLTPIDVYDTATGNDLFAVENAGDATFTLDTAGIAPAGAVCGNNIKEAGETCDGADLGGQTCVTRGFANGGVITCAADCQSFNTVQCAAGAGVAPGGGGGGGAGGGGGGGGGIEEKPKPKETPSSSCPQGASLVAGKCVCPQGKILQRGQCVPITVVPTTAGSQQPPRQVVTQQQVAEKQREIEREVEALETGSFMDTYGVYVIGIPFALLLIALIVFLFFRFFPKKYKQYDPEALRGWIPKEHAAGTTYQDIVTILNESTGWSISEIYQKYPQLQQAVIQEEKARQTGYDPAQLKVWVAKERAAGESIRDIIQILTDHIGWTKDQVLASFPQLRGA